MQLLTRIAAQVFCRELQKAEPNLSGSAAPVLCRLLNWSRSSRGLGKNKTQDQSATLKCVQVSLSQQKFPWNIPLLQIAGKLLCLQSRVVVEHHYIEKWFILAYLMWAFSWYLLLYLLISVRGCSSLCWESACQSSWSYSCK